MIPIDWHGLENLYHFTRLRAMDRLRAAEQDRDRHGSGRERHELRVIESMYAHARQHDDIVAACAVTYFRAQALRDAHHPEFLGEWIARTPRRSGAGAR